MWLELFRTTLIRRKQFPTIYRLSLWCSLVLFTFDPKQVSLRLSFIHDYEESVNALQILPKHSCYAVSKGISTLPHNKIGGYIKIHCLQSHIQQRANIWDIFFSFCTNSVT